ncbi:MAG: hypothetical protein AB7P49_05840 [Bdellovibrionales bacterium]
MGACEKIGMGVSSGKDCAEQMAECQKFDAEATELEENESSGESRIVDAEREAYQMEKKRLKHCPPLGKVGQKDLDDKIKDLRKEIRSAENELPTLKDEADQATRDSAQKVADLKKQAREAASEYQEQLKGARRDQEGKTKELLDKLFSLEEQVAKVDEQIDAVRLSRTDAAMKKAETITQIKLNCHASASATVEKKMAEWTKDARAGVLNRGDHTTIARFIGKTDREWWQEEAEKYYDWCIASTPTQASMKSAENIYEGALNQADRTEASLRARRDFIEVQKEQIKSPHGCPPVTQQADGTTNESEMCQAMRHMKENVAKLQADYNLKQEEFRSEAQRIETEGQQKYQTAMLKYNQKAQQVADDKDRLAMYKELLAAKYKAAGMNDTDAKALSDARLAYGEFIAQAEARVNCCNQNGETGRCEDAKNFLTRIGRPPALYPASRQTPSEGGGGEPTNHSPASVEPAPRTPSSAPSTGPKPTPTAPSRSRPLTPQNRREQNGFTERGVRNI